MKLTSKTLKKYIVEVIDEATRRDMLTGLGALGAATAIGGIGLLGDDEADVEEEAIEKEKEENQKRDASFKAMKEQARQNFNALMFNIDDPSIWVVAPTSRLMAYVPMEHVYEYMDKDLDLFIKADSAEDFFSTWRIGEIYRYLFGHLNFWGNAKRKDSSDQRVFWRITTDDGRGNQVRLEKLPTSWTVVLNVWLDRMLPFVSKLEETSGRQRELLLAKNSVSSEKELNKMIETYNNTIAAFSKPRYLDNVQHEDIY